MQAPLPFPTLSQIPEKPSSPTLPQIPVKSQCEVSPIILPTFPLPPPLPQEHIIPGYNYESLFRKKSHVRMARKKTKEEPHKKSTSIKMESLDCQAKMTQKGHWSVDENKLYHWFLEIHSQHFIQKHLRRTDKIFKAMANFIRTREAEQCRSHHQKMQKKYHNFYQILLKLRMQFYYSSNQEIIKLELQQNHYKIPHFTLLTEHELRSGQASQAQPRSNPNSSSNPNPSEKSAQNSIEYQQHNSSNNQHSLLGENYERQLNFHFQYS